MPVEILGAPPSANCMGPILLAKHLGVGDMTYTGIGESTAGGTQSPEYKAFYPFGGAPGLKDGEYTLGESNCILRYLGKKYGKGEYYPADAETSSKIDWALDMFSSKIYPHVVALCYPVMGFAAPKKDFSEDCTKAEADLATFCDFWLGEKTFMGGKTLNIADFKIAPFLYSLSLPDIASVTGLQVPDRVVQYVNDFIGAVPSAAMLESAGGFSIAEWVATKVSEMDAAAPEPAAVTKAPAKYYAAPTRMTYGGYGMYGGYGAYGAPALMGSSFAFPRATFGGVAAPPFGAAAYGAPPLYGSMAFPRYR